MNNSLRNHDYEATEASDMLPLQNLDEEWQNGGMFATYVHVRGCFDGQAADWITHAKWEEPHQEVGWRNDDVMEKLKDFPRRV